jgi:hypothetical protein
MLEWLFKRNATPVSMPELRPRGILPFVDAGRVTIRKAAPHVKNTYEVRLGLFMAVQQERLPFTLAVPPGALIAEELRAKISENGGSIVEEAPVNYTVYVGAEARDGAELDGWVLGKQSALAELSAAFGADWPGPALVPGAQFEGELLLELRAAIERAPLRLVNVDEEDVKGALLALIESARTSGGKVYVQ